MGLLVEFEGLFFSVYCVFVFLERGIDWVDFISRMEDFVEESFLLL